MQRSEFTSIQAEQQYGHMSSSYPLDLIEQGNPATIGGIPVIIGKDITYERTV
jgi:hypothetical protein